MNEYLTFDKFITPIIIQIIFWLGIAGIVIMSLLAIMQSPLAGLVTLIIGPIVWRIYMEIVLVIFKINDNLAAIRKRSENEGAFK